MPQQGPQIQRALNSFQKGMMKDVNFDDQPQGTYRDSQNGRIIFKGDSSYAWNNVEGNTLSFTLTFGYEVKGYAPFSNKLVVLSSNGTNSEIGYIDFPESKFTGNYNILFKDSLDPKGGKLNFKKKFKVVPTSETGDSPENERNIQRIYWTDDNDEIRAFNILLAQNEGIDTENGPYPDFYSVSSMSFQTNFDMGDIEFFKEVKGSLLSGSYQYAYRLITKDGYATPWTPPTRPMFVTDTVKNNTDWNKYRMKGVQNSTGKGNRIRVNIYDTRYADFEVAAIYSIANESPLEASIIYRGEIGVNLEPGSTTKHLVDHGTMAGTAIAPADIVQRFVSIERALEINSKDNILFLGNIEELPVPTLSQASLSSINIKPYFRFMKSDDKAAAGSLPFTHRSTSGSLTASKFKFFDQIAFGFEERDLNIEADYSNYKGVQVDNQFTGYFRGETYRFGIVLYDLKGNPGFVQHIADVTFPDIEGNSDQTIFKVNRLDTNGDITGEQTFYLKWGSQGTSIVRATNTGEIDYPTWLTGDQNWVSELPIGDGITFGAGEKAIRAMGAMFDDIDLTEVKGQISGYSIVRARRDKRNLGQGLLLNCVQIDNENPDEIYPLSTNYNLFSDSGLSDIDLNANGQFYNDSFANIRARGSSEVRYESRVFTLESPDIMMDGVPTLEGTDRIKAVGSLYAFTGGFLTPQIGGTNTNYYTKAYENFASGINNTHTFRSNAGSGQTKAIGSEHEISTMTTAEADSEIVEFNPNKTASIFKNKDTNVVFNTEQFVGYQADFNRFFGHDNTTLLVMKNLTTAQPTNADTAARALRYLIVNYTRTSGGTYGGLGEGSLKNTVYESIGEFQSVRSTNDAAFYDKIQQGSDYIVDGQEVWGGDCYLDYYAMCRLHADTTIDTAREASTGIIFPVESVNNHMIYRNNENFAEIGAVDENGFFINQSTDPAVEKREDYNALDLAQVFEGLATFFTSPIGFINNTDFPYRWLWSLKKVYGEAIDNFRQFPATNFRDVDGRYGEIIASSNLFNKMYSFQENAFAVLSINDREVVSTSSGGQLVIGQGQLMDREDYVSKEYGTQHQMSLFKSANVIYWFDAKKGKFCAFGGGGFDIISDAQGLNDFTSILSRDFINSGDVHGIYDFKNQEALWTLVKEGGQETSGGSGSVGIGSSIPTNSARGTIEIANRTGGGGFGTPVPPTALLSIVIDGVVQNDILFQEQVDPEPPLSLAEKIANNINSYVPASGPNYQAVLPTFQPTGKLIINIYAPEEIGADPNGTPILLTFVSPPTNYKWSTTDIDNGITPPLEIARAVTLGYSEPAKRFVGFYSFLPTIYMQYGDSLFSDRGYTENLFKNQHELYLHDEGDEGSFYGVLYNSSITFIVNDRSQHAKTFDNMIMNITQNGSDLIQTIELATELGTQILTFPDDRAKFREGLYRLPMREQSATARSRGTTVQVTIAFRNEEAKKIILSDIQTLYRFSRRI